MITRRDIEAALTLIRPHVRRTPVVVADDLWGDRDIEVKFEHCQVTGSFKPRGAFYTLLSNPVPEGGVVAASGGNHGAAVAHAAMRLGHRAAIFVPEIAGPEKIALIRETGAELTVVPGSYVDALRAAQDHEARTGAMQVHAYDAPETVAGQGTVMAEWDQQGLSADTVLIAVGGGGLIAGALAWLGTTRKVVAVEPVLAPSLNRALAEGRPVDVEVSGIAANALGARRIGGICHELASQTATQSVLVEDEAILAAQHLLWRRLRQVVEPAGATALAALTSGAYRPEPGEKVAILLCGANPVTSPYPATKSDRA